MKQKLYRHGEIGLLKIEKLPKDIKLSDSKIFMVGSHGHNHSIDQGKIYLLEKPDEQVFGYLVANDTSLLHPEHSPNVGDAKLPNGLYKLLKQVEYTPSGLIPIAD